MCVHSTYARMLEVFYCNQLESSIATPETWMCVKNLHFPPQSQSASNPLPHSRSLFVPGLNRLTRTDLVYTCGLWSAGGYLFMLGWRYTGKCSILSNRSNPLSLVVNYSIMFWFKYFVSFWLVLNPVVIQVLRLLRRCSHNLSCIYCSWNQFFIARWG